MTAAWIAIGVVVLVALIFVLIRNSIIHSRNRVEEAWSGIDVQLKRRYALVPSLVETVGGYAQHERQTLEKVTEACADAMRSSGPRAASKAEGALTAALGDLRAIAESHPDLRATESFQQLSRNLAELEDEIQASRRIYNSNVQAYNARIQIFPNSIVASAGGFEPRDFFEIEVPGEREVAQVSLSDPPPAPAE